MKVFYFCILCLFISMAVIAGYPPVSGAQTSVYTEANCGPITHTVDAIAETGTNIAKFGDKNASYNQLTTSVTKLSLGRSYLDSSDKLSAVSSNKITNENNMQSRVGINSDKRVNTLTAGMVETSGCDAGSLGVATQKDSTGLSTSYPTTNLAGDRHQAMIFGENSKVIDKSLLIGDDQVLESEVQFDQGFASRTMRVNTIKSFSKNLTENYDVSAQIHTNAVAFPNMTSHIVMKDSSLNMSSAFDKVEANTTDLNAVSTKVKTIIQNQSQNVTESD